MTTRDDTGREVALPACRHRGDEIRPGRWVCRSGRLIIPLGLVDGDDCRRHCPFIDHPTADAVPDGDGDAVWPVVADQKVPIAIAVTTAPRNVPTLGATLRELRRAGFAQPIHVFAEPDSFAELDSSVPDLPGVVVTRNAFRKGIWDNWRGAAFSLLDNTDAPFLLICQDDLVLAPGAAAALQHAIGTLDQQRWGLASLYTPRFAVRGALWRGWRSFTGRSTVWGALAYCFTRDSLTELLSSPLARRHATQHSIDFVLTEGVRRLGRRRDYHLPSLCAHAGAGNSSVGHAPHPESAAVAFSAGFAGYFPPRGS